MRYKIALSLTFAITLSACAPTPAKHVVASPPAKPAPAAREERSAMPELANTSVAELERMVAAGDLKAHVELGTRYGLGKGVEKNYEKAVALLRAAAERNDPAAQFLLGTAYYNGAGVPKDEGMAVLWFERSAAQHYAVADYWMGFMIAYGKGGISPTWVGAVPYLWDGAIQGDAAAAFLLGYAYDKGTDIDRNTKAAAYWYRRADSPDVNVKAEYNLLLLINHGEAQWEPTDRVKHDDTTSPPKPEPESHN